MGCARCHDHKFDPISQTEFYQFLGFFNSVNEKGVYTETRGNVPPLGCRCPTPDDTSDSRELDWRSRRRPGPDGETTRTRCARSSPRQKDEFEKHDPHRDGDGRPAEAAADVSCSSAASTTCPTRARSSSRAFPRRLPPLPAERRATGWGWRAGWSSPENPLTARVAVNRIWQHHFGMGLVKTAENFGIQGEPPSHPELLDWLATELVRIGLGRQGDAPADRHQRDLPAGVAARPRAAGARPGEPPAGARAAVPAPGRSRARQRPGDRRPAVNQDRRAVGQAVSARRPLGGAGRRRGRGAYVQDKGPDLYRRSLYVYRKRTVPHPVLATFDAPSREICQVKRPRTNTPLQALELLNDVTYVEAARHLAQLMIDEGGSTADDRIALRVPPRDRAMPIARPSSRSCGAGWSDTDRLPRRPEAALAADPPRREPARPEDRPVELAAYTATAGVILNLDETITQE